MKEEMVLEQATCKLEIVSELYDNVETRDENHPTNFILLPTETIYVPEIPISVEKEDGLDPLEMAGGADEMDEAECRGYSVVNRFDIKQEEVMLSECDASDDEHDYLPVPISGDSAGEYREQQQQEQQHQEQEASTAHGDEQLEEQEQQEEDSDNDIMVVEQFIPVPSWPSTIGLKGVMETTTNPNQNQTAEDDDSSASSEDDASSAASEDDDPSAAPEDGQESSTYRCVDCGHLSQDLKQLTKHRRSGHRDKKTHQCTFGDCGKTFENTYKLAAHWRSHAEDKVYSCTYCMKEFATSAFLDCHLDTHVGGKPYTCSLCEESFATSLSLSRHLHTHASRQSEAAGIEKTSAPSEDRCDFVETHRCVECGQECTNGNELVMHRRWMHPKLNPYQCTYSQCGKSFARITRLTTHLRTHTGAKPFCCSYCRKSFSSSTVLSRHLRIHTGGSCPCCKKHFPTSSLLSQHVRNHVMEDVNQAAQAKARVAKAKVNTSSTSSGSVGRDISCADCELFCVDAAQLELHRRLRHSNRNPHQCPRPQCGKSFKQESALDKHMQIHTKALIVGNPYSCAYCDERFASAKILSQHLHTHNRKKHNQLAEVDEGSGASEGDGAAPAKGVRAFPQSFCCAECWLDCGDAKRLEQHRRQWHRFANPYQCSHARCGKSFRSAPFLTVHMRYHSGEKPFSCAFCKKRFTGPVQLTKHLRTHTGVKPFSCPHCKRRFVTSSSLHQHVRNHNTRRYRIPLSPQTRPVQ